MEFCFYFNPLHLPEELTGALWLVVGLRLFRIFGLISKSISGGRSLDVKHFDFSIFIGSSNVFGAALDIVRVRFLLLASHRCSAS